MSLLLLIGSSLSSKILLELNVNEHSPDRHLTATYLRWFGQHGSVEVILAVREEEVKKRGVLLINLTLDGEQEFNNNNNKITIRRLEIWTRP